MGSKMIMRSDGTEANLPDNSRNREILQARKTKEEKMVQETLILQKVNKIHRVAFKDRFPGQIEHCMRLTVERLQALLANKPADLTDTSTWSGKPDEILALSHGLYYLSIMNQHYPVETE